MTATPTRRQLLSATALLPVAACTRSEPPAKVDPDARIRSAAVGRELTLVALYDAAIAVAPVADRARLTAVRAEHLTHLTALGSQPPSPLDPPVDARSRAGLVEAERSMAVAHAAAALDASPSLAAVLASLAASEASHPVALA